MKVTVDLPEQNMRDICRITGNPKKGPAIRQLLDDALQLQRRKEVAGKFLSGEWGTELKGFEQSKTAERKKSDTRSKRWRD